MDFLFVPMFQTESRSIHAVAVIVVVVCVWTFAFTWTEKSNKTFTGNKFCYLPSVTNSPFIVIHEPSHVIGQPESMHD